MIVVLIVVGVRLLLEVGPAADILQTLRGVPNLNQAHGLQWAETHRRMGLASGRLLGVEQVVVLTEFSHWGSGSRGHSASW